VISRPPASPTSTSSRSPHLGRLTPRGREAGYYLIDAPDATRLDLDLEADLFRLPVQGFAVEAGRATAPVSKAHLTGGVGALLRGIAAVGRDLSFEMLDGMIGSPSLLVMGPELRGE